MNAPSLRSAILSTLGIGSILSLTAPASLAQQAPQLEELSPETGWFIRLGAFMRTGAKASLKDLQPSTPSLGSAATGFTYDNGFVKPDASGSATDTYNWGYTGTGSESHAGVPQHVPGGSTLTFQHLANAPRVGDVDLGSPGVSGGQITGGIEIGRFKVARREVKWGFEVGYAFSSLSVHEAAQSTSKDATLTTDAYSLLDGGKVLVPPQAPFTGSLTGPNFLLPRVPASRTTVTASGTGSLDATLDSNLHALHVGPWFELPLGTRAALALSLGFVTTLADSELRVAESTTYAGDAIPGRDLGTEGFRHSAWLPGAFAQLRASYNFTEMIGVYFGGEVQWNKDLQFVGRSREAEIRFGATFGAVAGINLSF